VNSIRAEVDAWRNSDYTFPKGISSTSLRLLEFWFGQDHLNNGALFHFRFAQREAIETVIYLCSCGDVVFYLSIKTGTLMGKINLSCLFFFFSQAA